MRRRLLLWDTYHGTDYFYARDTVTFQCGSGTKYTYDDGTNMVRKRVDGSYYKIDIAYTQKGFNGDEGLDWETLQSQVIQGCKVRTGVRDGYWVVDATITSTGFSGTEDTDWENIQQSKSPAGISWFRDGVRSGGYVVDQALTSTGFNGVENTDWENIIKLS